MTDEAGARARAGDPPGRPRRTRVARRAARSCVIRTLGPGLALGLVLGAGGLSGAPVARAQEPIGPVSGVVRASGVPVPNAWVTITPVSPTGAWAGRATTMTSGPDGTYRADVGAGHVKVQVRAPSLSGLASAYWPDAYSFQAAGILPVGAPGATADVDLRAGATITGRVVDRATGQPLAGARVQAHVEAAPGWEAVGEPAMAPGAGEFRIVGLPPVPVSLQVAPPEGGNHLGQWFDDAGYFGDAVRVEPGAAGIVIGLREGGSLAGEVRDDTGAPVASAVVTIIGCPALCPLQARTDAAGRYRIPAVPPGPALRAYADGAHAGLLNAWYAPPPGSTRRGLFDLAAGQAVDDLDFTLTAGAVVTGTVLDVQTGAPIPGVAVDLLDRGNALRAYGSRSPAGAGVAAGVGDTGVDPGTGAGFIIGPVPPGSYSVVVLPGSGNADYLPVQWVTSAGLDGPGTLELERGEQVAISLGLARRTPDPGTRQPGTVGADVGTRAPPGLVPVPPSGGSGQWPGLSRGFLAVSLPGLPAGRP
jgi:hypothetical protein